MQAPVCSRLPRGDLSAFDVSFFPVGEVVAVRGPLLALRDYEFESVVHVRNPPAHRNQPQMPGYLWVVKGGRLLVYESRLEMLVMLALDYHRDVVAFSSQPHRYHERGVRRGARRHVPDLFVRLRDGSAVVIDVVPDKKRDSPKRAPGVRAGATRLSGRRMDVSAAGRTRTRGNNNITALSGFRREPAALADHEQRILAATESPIRIDELLLRLSDEEVLPCVFHLVWRGTLDLSIRKPLTYSSVIRQRRPNHGR